MTTLYLLEVESQDGPCWITRRDIFTDELGWHRGGLPCFTGIQPEPLELHEIQQLEEDNAISNGGTTHIVEAL